MKESNDRRSDGELVDACNAAAPAAAAAAFNSLYARHRAYVLRVALRFTRDPDLAADALQETFLYLLRQFPPAGPGFTLTARMQTFLYPVAKNCAISAIRKSKRYAPCEIEPDELADARLPAEPGMDDIDAALAGLSSERREVLLLRFVDGLTLDEIAAALDVPLGTVKSRLHIGLKQLREDPRIKKSFAT